jgi:hypothetical protein
MRVHRTGAGEDEARKLLVDRADHAVEGVASVNRGDRVDVPHVGREQIVDRGPAGRRVPTREMTLRLAQELDVPHPDGMAPRIANLAEWRAHLLHRLDRQAAATADPVLRALHDELAALPGGTAPATPDGLVVPLTLRTGDGGELRFFSVTAVLGTPLDVTLSELAIESFLPANPQTAAALGAR